MPPAVIPSVTSEPLRKLLSDASRSDPGELAIQIVKTQVAQHETRRNRRKFTRREPDGKLPSLFDAATETLVGSISEDAEDSMRSMDGLPPNVLSRIALKLENIPYEMFCRARLSAGEHEADADEWVLRNEVWLREASTTGSIPPKNICEGQAIARTKKSDWAHGLVQLSPHADVVFPGSILTETCRVITRPTDIPGFKILDRRRPPAIRIQPSVEMFGKTFEAMTDGLLKGLDWENVFVAGGIVLGTLLCTSDKETTNTSEKWKSSDVDLYIHGLGPVAANKKIEHIFSVFKTNVGEDKPVLVVRNSKTITFFSKYPIRRIQVVLKLVESPKDVLLNFDLDICAMGWDGEDLWMLPRAARALETGYTVFTMDLINGHYLGDRRATQEQRVFKYADRGYGVRILPCYLEEYKTITDDPEKQKKFHDIKHWDLREFENLVEDARQWTDLLIKEYVRSQDDEEDVPILSHFTLQEKSQDSEDSPGRSSLSGLSLFIRHVALWEQEVIGAAIIDKRVWAAPTYNDLYLECVGVSYNDAPDYLWDENFTHEHFIHELSKFNQIEFNRYTGNIIELLPEGRHLRYGFAPLPDYLKRYLPEDSRIQRISYATSVEEILQPECDIFLPIWLPKAFIDFVDDLVPETAAKSAALPSYAMKAFMPALKADLPPTRADSEGLRLVIWHITRITMWQQLNRTIDEVHEVLWSFHHANAGLGILEKEDRMKLLVRQFGRRAIRMTAKDEYGEFSRWVARRPAAFTNYSHPYIRFLSQESDYEDE